MQGECTHRFARFCNEVGEHVFATYEVTVDDGNGTHYTEAVVAMSQPEAAIAVLGRHGLLWDRRATATAKWLGAVDTGEDGWGGIGRTYEGRTIEVIR
jgi:hypothetical protein